MLRFVEYMTIDVALCDPHLMLVNVYSMSAWFNTSAHRNLHLSYQGVIS